MKTRAAIIDYGMGNLYSVKKAFESISVDAFLARLPRELDTATHIVLPGVGAFADAIAALRSKDFIAALNHWATSGKPLLGICLGMQLLMDKSMEDGDHAGLALLSGTVSRLNTPHKVPHMGWNTIETDDACPLFRGLPKEPYAYFVHSYALPYTGQRHAAAVTEYGCRFVSAVWQDSVCGLQFHPEKSDNHGLAMLHNFSRIQP